MTRSISRSLAVLAALVLSFVAPAAHAATASASFNVTATVLTSCTVSATDLAFGTYNTASPSDTLATSTINVTCSLLTPYTISVDGGAHASGSTRQMASGSARLAYEIYRNVGLSNIFGTVAAALGVSGIGTGFAVPTTVYGKIPKNQAVVSGNYADVLTVTIDY